MRGGDAYDHFFQSFLRDVDLSGWGGAYEVGRECGVGK